MAEPGGTYKMCIPTIRDDTSDFALWLIVNGVFRKISIKGCAHNIFDASLDTTTNVQYSLKYNGNLIQAEPLPNSIWTESFQKNVTRRYPTNNCYTPLLLPCIHDLVITCHVGSTKLCHLLPSNTLVVFLFNIALIFVDEEDIVVVVGGDVVVDTAVVAAIDDDDVDEDSIIIQKKEIVAMKRIRKWFGIMVNVIHLMGIHNNQYFNNIFWSWMSVTYCSIPSRIFIMIGKCNTASWHAVMIGKWSNENTEL